MLDFLKSIYYEFLSYFVPEKMEYEITGECKKCGKCCNYMYSFDTYTPKEFKIMQFLYPAYKRFYIKGKDKDGNLIFACKYVTKRGYALFMTNVLQCASVIPCQELATLQTCTKAVGIRYIKRNSKII